MLPLAPAGASAVDPADLLEIELDDIMPPASGSAWDVVDAAAPLEMTATARLDLAPDRLVLPVSGIETMGYEARVTGGELRVLVDGVVVRTLGPGEHVRDVAIATWHGEVAWEFAPSDVDDQVWLTLRGARPLLDPVVSYLSRYLWSWCGEEPTLHLGITFSLPLVDATVDVSLGEEQATLDVGSGGFSGDQRWHWVHMDVPTRPDGTPELVDATLRDVWGNVWDLLVDAPVRHERIGTISAAPDGWVYDRRPQIAAFSGCALPDMSNVRFTMDGEDLTDQLVWCDSGIAFTFDRDLAFGERHQYRFEITLADGTSLVREGEIIEGLDVMEVDVDRLALAFEEVYVKANDVEWKTYQAFADLVAPEERPPLYTTMLAPVGSPGLIMSLEPVHVLAVYAPHDIVCERKALGCDAVTGTAPQYSPMDHLAASELVVTSASGERRAYPGIGQFFAASSLTEIGRGAQEIAEYEQGWAEGLAALTLALAEDEQEYALALVGQTVPPGP